MRERTRPVLQLRKNRHCAACHLKKDEEEEEEEGGRPWHRPLDGVPVHAVLCTPALTALDADKINLTVHAVDL